MHEYTNCLLDRASLFLLRNSSEKTKTLHVDPHFVLYYSIQNSAPVIQNESNGKQKVQTLALCVHKLSPSVKNRNSTFSLIDCLCTESGA